MRRPGRAWRVLQFPATRLVVMAVVLVGSSVAVELIASALGWGRYSPASCALRIGLCAVSVAEYVALVRWIERRPVVELAGAGAAGDLGCGFALGAGLFGTTILVLCVAGIAAIGPGDGSAAIAPALIFSLVAAVTEELLLRGVLFRILEDSLGTWIALGVSAAVFGLAHAGNHGATIVSTLAVALEAGGLLGAAYLYSRRLWLPIAVHMGWNLAEAISGSAVSGGTMPGVWSSRFTGPALVTGGAFGPEASIVAMVVCLVAAVILVAAGQRRGRMLRPWWSRSK